ncbi:MAG: hypothetical protein Q7W54_05535 [Bacteroidota bacterium]|nr:hypothetical protein [Bacteroidota bacterium]
MKLDHIVQNYGKGGGAAFLFSLFSPLGNNVQAQVLNPVQKKYNVVFMDTKLDSLHQLYHVTDKVFTKSNPENI